MGEGQGVCYTLYSAENGPTAKNDLAQNVTCAEIEKPWLRPVVSHPGVGLSYPMADPGLVSVSSEEVGMVPGLVASVSSRVSLG